MMAVLADPALYRFTGGEPPSLEALRRQYTAQVTGASPDGAERWLNWVVRLALHDRQDGAGQVIGFVQATVTGGGRNADIAWVIGVRWQGQGHAAEAATAMVAWLLETGATAISAHVHPDHVASERVAARAGLVATDELEDGERVWRLGPGPG